MEILSVDGYIEGRGTGTALLNAAVAHIREVGLSKVSVITTNDNLGATYRHGSGMDDIPKKVVDLILKVSYSIARSKRRGISSAGRAHDWQS